LFGAADSAVDFDESGLVDKEDLEIFCTDVGRINCPVPPSPADLNQDGKIDENDLDIFLDAFGTCTGEPGFILEADYDGDGCIGNSDYMIWYQYFSENF